jgi:hypothetical protein
MAGRTIASEDIQGCLAALYACPFDEMAARRRQATSSGTLAAQRLTALLEIPGAGASERR